MSYADEREAVEPAWERSQKIAAMEAQKRALLGQFGRGNSSLNTRDRATLPDLTRRAEGTIGRVHQIASIVDGFADRCLGEEPTISNGLSAAEEPSGGNHLLALDLILDQLERAISRAERAAEHLNLIG